VGICSFLFDKLEQYESIGGAFLEKEAEPTAQTKPSGEKQPVKRCVMDQAKRFSVTIFLLSAGFPRGRIARLR
jgi:hypothetical protein